MNSKTTPAEDKRIAADVEYFVVAVVGGR